MSKRYDRVYRAVRRETSKLTIQQQRDINKLYTKAINDLSVKFARSKDGTLTKAFYSANRKSIIQARNELNRELNKSIRGYTTKVARVGIRGEQIVMNDIFKRAGITIGTGFVVAFFRVQHNTLRDIIQGNMYKDNKTLSDRIWNFGKVFEKDIQYTINQAIIQKKSAIELARDLEIFVKDSAKRPYDWGKVYPGMKSKKVDYNAMRLARTSLNHAYQRSVNSSAEMNPFIEGILWFSQMGPRTCDLCIERATTDQFGLGEGVFPKDQVPDDHPNGLCTMIPWIPKSFDEIATELRDWYDGEENDTLDEWYKVWGLHFINKR